MPTRTGGVTSIPFDIQRDTFFPKICALAGPGRGESGPSFDVFLGKQWLVLRLPPLGIVLLNHALASPRSHLLAFPSAQRVRHGNFESVQPRKGQYRRLATGASHTTPHKKRTATRHQKTDP